VAHRSPDLNHCDFYLWGKLQSVYANNPHDLEALKQNTHEAIYNTNVNCKKFPELCLKQFRHVSQQRVDNLNIFYDGEYNVNYYI
jgi:hypothetical protein